MSSPWPAGAQPAAMPAIGFLRSTSSQGFEHVTRAFHEGLREAGMVDGRDVTVIARYADQHIERLPALADELIARGVAVIVGNSVAAEAVKRRTTQVPIVFVTADDPVRRGLVASLARPGGNATGVTFFGGGQLGGKRYELLQEIAPSARPVAFLRDANWPTAEDEMREARDAARSRGQPLLVASAASSAALAGAFDELARNGARSLMVGGSPTFTAARAEIVRLVARHRWPAIYDQRDYVDAGGLMSYGGTLAGAYRQAAAYAAEIVRGARPADLPVLQPTTFGLVLNAATARSLALEVPGGLRLRAEAVVG